MMNDEVCTIQRDARRRTMKTAGRETAKLCWLPKRIAAMPSARKRKPEKIEKGGGANGASMASCRNEIELQCVNASNSVIATAMEKTHASTGDW